MQSTPRFLQGVFPFQGEGLDSPVTLDAALSYTVPNGLQGTVVADLGLVEV